MNTGNIEISHKREVCVQVLNWFMSRCKDLIRLNENYWKNMLMKYNGGDGSTLSINSDFASKLKYILSMVFKVFISRSGHPETVTYETYKQFRRNDDPYFAKIEGTKAYADKINKVMNSYIKYCQEALELISKSEDAAELFYDSLLENKDFTNASWYVMKAVESCGVKVSFFTRRNYSNPKEVDLDPREEDFQYIPKYVQKIKDLVNDEWISLEKG